jgi:hypothetical protein
MKAITGLRSSQQERVSRCFRFVGKERYGTTAGPIAIELSPAAAKEFRFGGLACLLNRRVGANTSPLLYRD